MLNKFPECFVLFDDLAYPQPEEIKQCSFLQYTSSQTSITPWIPKALQLKEEKKLFFSQALNKISVFLLLPIGFKFKV